ncbi:hypothetical protein WICMUC_001677 [Wickerhamomyces mucosus]|uniref:Arrestin C-terminal-like domain-containing protein n=1 Tax=Wickerhamomyces mucosus TaxID=1378264 RepID=A0A9P8PTL2_9ASCO|nr:hypothetical protein WICMUC_001677 [Wickerhamomyces mucosus]
MVDFTVNLKPSNKPLVQGCPGVPKTYPTINSTLEIRSISNQQILIDHIVIKFVTIDSFLKGKPRDVPSSVKKINYEYTTKINDRLISMDLPFLIGLQNELCPTSSNFKVSTEHFLEVAINHGTNGKLLKTVEFPIIITTFDTLPLYRQFNQLVTKTVDSKDHNVILEYSLPTNAIGLTEELNINLKILNNQSQIKKIDRIKLKKISSSLIEVFDCRCDKSFIKETVIQTHSKDYSATLGLKGINEQIIIKFDDESIFEKFKIFNKHEDIDLMKRRHPPQNIQLNSQDLKAQIIQNGTLSIPLNQYGNITKKSNLFNIYFELKILLKFSGAKDIEIRQPVTISFFDRIKSLKLLKWIMKETELSLEFLNRLESEIGRIKFNNKYNVLEYPQRKPIILRSKEDKDKFL